MEKLPPLREEIEWFPSATAWNGSRTWILNDPVRNRYYRLTWSAFEMLVRWDAGSPEAIIRRVAEETTLRITISQVEGLVRFLAAHQLIRAGTARDTERLEALAKQQDRSWAASILHHYLFFRIPLVRSDHLLSATLPWVQWLGGSLFRWMTVLAMVLGVLLVSRQWDVFSNSLVDTLSFDGMISYGLALALVKLIHELSHAYTARSLGCRVPTMGVAFLVLWPLLYTDLNEIWKLPHLSNRLRVAAAGVVAELSVAAWATLAWSFLPEGRLRQAVFILATMTWISSLLINSNPFMRFDGYFLLMDLLNLPNLHRHAFALALWRLREFLFGLGDSPPRSYSTPMRRFLIFFAFATWIYRLVLFMGIAFLVYHFFIKAVGIFLFMVEMGVFVVLPVAREISVWRKLGGQIAANRAAVAGSLLALGLLVFPWQGRISAPAIHRAEFQSALYLPRPGQLREILVQPGTLVTKGMVLYTFDVPDLEEQLLQTTLRRASIAHELHASGFDPVFRQKSKVLLEQWATNQAEAEALQSEQEQMTVRAPWDGILVDTPTAMRPGDWFSAKESLGTVRSDGQGVIQALVTEQDLTRLEEGADGWFLPEAQGRPSLRCSVILIKRDALRALPDPILALPYGGSVPVREQNGVLIPNEVFYPVWLSGSGTASPAMVQRGTVLIEGTRHSLLLNAVRAAASVLVRELTP